MGVDEARDGIARYADLLTLRSGGLLVQILLEEIFIA
jgi:hypothetical protein